MSHKNWLVLGALGALLAASACSKQSSADSKTEETPAAAQTAGAGDKAAPPAAAKTAPAAPLKGKSYGAGVDATETVAITDLLADPKAYAGKNVRVEGTVTDVCPKRGCWFEMAGEKPGEKMRFKVRDGVMTFPMDAKGKYAVAQGVVNTRDLTLEETRKYLKYQAEEYGKDVDPASVTEPMTMIQLNGKGAVIRDGK